MYTKGGIVTCKNCGASFTAKSDMSVMIVCDRCNNVNYKYGDKSTIVAAIPEDMSLIKIGTQGKIDDKEFEIIGRYKIDAEAGYYNWWVVHFKKDDLLGWLIDSYGEYVLAGTVTLEPDKLMHKMWISHCGFKFDLPPLGEYRLITRPEALTSYIEGELPETPENIHRVKFLEFLKGTGIKVYLFEDGDNVICVSGNEKEWTDFQFTNVRKFPVLDL